VAEGWRRLHNKELHNVFALSNLVRVIKSKRSKWVGHVAGMGEMRNLYSILVVKFEMTRPLGILHYVVLS